MKHRPDLGEMCMVDGSVTVSGCFFDFSPPKVSTSACPVPVLHLSLYSVRDCSSPYPHPVLRRRRAVSIRSRRRLAVAPSAHHDAVHGDVAGSAPGLRRSQIAFSAARTSGSLTTSPSDCDARESGRLSPCSPVTAHS